MAPRIGAWVAAGFLVAGCAEDNMSPSETEAAFARDAPGILSVTCEPATGDWSAWDHRCTYSYRSKGRVVTNTLGVEVDDDEILSHTGP